MIGRYACLIAAMASFSECAVLGENAAAASGSDQPGATAEQRPSTTENPDPRQPPPQGNPLSRIPIDSLSVTRERPLFSATRRPPPPPPAPPAPNVQTPPSAELERPGLTLQGTAIGNPGSLAVVLDETTKGSVRLHVGEAAAGWSLRSIGPRAVTVEKDSRVVTLFLPAPGAALSNPTALASDPSDQPRRSSDGRAHAKNGADWISIAHTQY